MCGWVTHYATRVGEPNDCSTTTPSSSSESGATPLALPLARRLEATCGVWQQKRERDTHTHRAMSTWRRRCAAAAAADSPQLALAPRSLNHHTDSFVRRRPTRLGGVGRRSAKRLRPLPRSPLDSSERPARRRRRRWKGLSEVWPLASGCDE